MDIQDTFPQRVWQIVASIPEGFVTTYGDVARLAGSLRARSAACLSVSPKAALCPGIGWLIVMVPFR